MDTNLETFKNHAQRQHDHYHPSSSSSSASYDPEPLNNNHHQGLISFNSIFIIIISIISIFVLCAVLLIILLLHRLKSGKEKKSLECKERSNIINNCETFIPNSSINIESRTSSPDVKGGCLYSTSTTSFKQQSQQQQQRGRRKSRVEGVQVYTYKELEIATNNFSDENLIGNGGFGVVYKGVLRDGTLAAIKRLHLHNGNGSGKHEERSFRLEVDLLTRLHCPYLVELLGYCADQNHRILIFEFMPNGTLEHHLHDHRRRKSDNQFQSLDWGKRLRIALDCARALEFLHEFVVPAVIHRDFKCNNILLDHNFRAKVSDFGLAKLGSDKINGQISTRVLGTTGYLAPEYASTGKLTTKSDVYSYGVILLQLLTGRTPIDPSRPPGEHVLVSWALPRLTNREKVCEMVDPTLQGQYSQKDLIQVAAIAAVCVQSEADYRPFMTDVVQSLIPLVKGFNNNSSCRFPTPSPDLS